MLTWCFLSYALISEGKLGVKSFHNHSMEQCPEATQRPQRGNSHKHLTNRFLLKSPSQNSP